MTGAGPEPPEREVFGDARRVTVDVDDGDALALYRAWSALAEAPGFRRAEARVSSSGDGYHVRAWFDAAAVDAAAAERMRLAAGDDVRRVRLDRTHGAKPHQMLFTEKPGGRAGPWRPDPWLAAEDREARGAFEVAEP